MSRLIAPGKLSRLLWLLPLALLAARAQAEPYLAVQMGFKCGVCHVNPTGGGQRTPYGETFAQTVLPAKRIDTGSGVWTGDISKFLSIGGDLRADGTFTRIPGSASANAFDLQQARVYLDVAVIPQRLLVYADEQLAPGGAINREAYGLYWFADHEWYIKAGQMYLPFGFRLQDQTAFVQQITGINMTTPDQGVELGWEHDHWDAQLTVSNGTAGGAEVNQGKQYGSQLQYVESQWRVGLAVNTNDAAIGRKSAYGLFAGLRTGPIEWLAQVDTTDDQSLPNGGLKELATLFEGNWRIAQGHNLKITTEFLNPNRRVPNGEQTRNSIVYELTPIQFLQLRAGFRYSDGIPQDPAEHERLAFIELHGFF